MANGIIKALFSRTTPELGTAQGQSSGTYTANCFKIGDLKIQWGSISAEARTHHRITFKEPFTSIGYAAFASYSSSNAVAIINPSATITDQHVDYCTIYTDGGPYAWLCIGY